MTDCAPHRPAEQNDPLRTIALLFANSDAKKVTSGEGSIGFHQTPSAPKIHEHSPRNTFLVCSQLRGVAVGLDREIMIGAQIGGVHSPIIAIQWNQSSLRMAHCFCWVLMALAHLLCII
jgi:hypothetical protein